MMRWLRGYVRLELKGNHVNHVLRQLVQQEFFIWHVQMRSDDPSTAIPRMSCYMRLSDVYRLRPTVRGTQTKVRFVERRGLPFFMKGLQRRTFFWFAGCSCLVALWLCSMLVWHISIVGNDRLLTQDILDEAKKQGIRPYAWKWKLAPADELARNLQLQLPDTSWVGVTIRGTHVTIQVVESAIQEEKKLDNPCHIIASKDAWVTQIMTYQGKSQVEANSYVRRGDRLISGIVGEGDRQQTVVAKGKVRGIVWYAVDIESPLHNVYQIYTGAESKRYYLVWGNRALQLYRERAAPFATYVTTSHHHVLAWRHLRLPLSWLTETLREAHSLEQHIEVQEAKQLGLKQAKLQLLQQSDEYAQVISEKILHEKTENGKVYMKALFEVEESIMQIQPIVVQGD